jgi:hypothetical protein
MKRFLFSLLCLSLIHTAAYAEDYAKLSIHIADPVKTNKYFLCVYGVGCLSIKKGNQGVSYVIPPMDVGNIEKFVITNGDNMQVFMQPTDKSCDVKVSNGQKLTISGQMVVHNDTPSINKLHCQVA